MCLESLSILCTILKKETQDICYEKKRVRKDDEKRERLLKKVPSKKKRG
jgi:hypothetical protein